MKNPLILFSVLTICSCSPDPTVHMDTYTGSSRVEVKRIGVIEDDRAYCNRRGIYIIKDKDSGKEFIGVSGIGISELGSHSAGKSTISDER